MAKKDQSAERSRNIWAPWRVQYIDSLAKVPDGCFLCLHRDDKENDRKNLVLWRGKYSFAVLNLFPYTSGHSMVAPYKHVGQLDDIDSQTMVEMFGLIRDTQKVLSEAVRAQGFNIGMNVGRPAGAGLPDHLHIHIVPRWSGDTNFIAVMGGVRVIPQSLEDLYDLMQKTAAKLKLPKLK